MESLYFHPENEGCVEAEDSTNISGPPSKSLENEDEDKDNEKECE